MYTCLRVYIPSEPLQARTVAYVQCRPNTRILASLMEKEIATHSSILAWEIPWTEEPGGLQSMGSQRVEHDSAPTMKGTSQCKILFL